MANVTTPASEFTPNGVYASFVQGNVTHYTVQYQVCEESKRPSLVWIDGFGWAQKEITEEEYLLLRGEMVLAENPLLNNGFFNLKSTTEDNKPESMELSEQLTEEAFQFITANFVFEKVKDGLFGKSGYGADEWVKYFSRNGSMSYSSTGSIKDVIAFDDAQSCANFIQAI